MDQTENDNQWKPHHGQAIFDPETLLRWLPTLCTCQKLAQPLRILIIFAVITFPVIIAVTISNFAFKVTSSTLSLHLFTNKLDHFIGQGLQHSLDIGHF
jgi:hypothetical protein